MKRMPARRRAPGVACLKVTGSRHLGALGCPCMKRKPERAEREPDAADTDQSFTRHVTVDGIEGTVARVELPDGTTEDWSLSSLPKGVKEGDVVKVRVEGGDVEVETDHAETKRRREKAQAQMDALNVAPPAGEINL